MSTRLAPAVYSESIYCFRSILKVLIMIKKCESFRTSELCLSGLEQSTDLKEPFSVARPQDRHYYIHGENSKALQ